MGYKVEFEHKFTRRDEAMLHNPNGDPIHVVVYNVQYDVTNNEIRYGVRHKDDELYHRTGAFPSVAEYDLSIVK